MAAFGSSGGVEAPRDRTGSIGPVLTFQDSAISVIGGSFRLLESEKSPSGYTLYKLHFKVGLSRDLSKNFIYVLQVQTDTPQGQPIIEEVRLSFK